MKAEEIAALQTRLNRAAQLQRQIEAWDHLATECGKTGNAAEAVKGIGDGTGLLSNLTQREVRDWMVYAFTEAKKRTMQQLDAM